MKARLFEELPNDVSELIVDRLSLQDFMRLRRVNRGGREVVDGYILKLCHINNLAKLSRADISYLLQNIFAPDSSNFAQLRAEALNPNANDAVYALYALAANVTELDHARLLTAINSLRASGCSERILRSLNIIHHYLTHGNEFDGELRILMEGMGDAYINLRGATLVANFYKCDLSYADLRNTRFECLVSEGSLQGANMCGAIVTDRTIMLGTNTTDLKCEGLVNEGLVLEEEEDPVTHELRPTIPAFAALFQQRAQQPQKSKSIFGCYIL